MSRRNPWAEGTSRDTNVTGTLSQQSVASTTDAMDL
jgi:hypothetical protein